MNNLILIFFALPLAVVIVSIALQKLFDSPALVAGIIFVVFLVVHHVLQVLHRVEIVDGGDLPHIRV